MNEDNVTNVNANETKRADDQAGVEEPHLGPWVWEPGAEHILNAPNMSATGEGIDEATVVLMLSKQARWHLKPANASLLASASDLLYACEQALVNAECT